MLKPPWKSGALATRQRAEMNRGSSHGHNLQMPEMPYDPHFQNRRCNPCGNPVPPPRIKPVIARDTTYCVSLLTDTIYGSNFAFPYSNFPASREWVRNETSELNPAEGARQR